jgi:small neutral amino acid transporter SnatA (MarC family)
MNGKGKVDIIILLRVIIAFIGIVLLLLGISGLSSSNVQRTVIGVIEILVGIVLVALGIRPASLKYILQGRIPTSGS